MIAGEAPLFLSLPGTAEVSIRRSSGLGMLTAASIAGGASVEASGLNLGAEVDTDVRLVQWGVSP